MKRLILCALLAACGSGEAGSSASSTVKSGSATPAGPVTDGGVLDGGPVQPKSYVGVVFPSDVLDISPLAPGKIATVNVRNGDQVKAGDVLAEMDPTSMEEELRGAQADYNAAQAAARQANVDVEDAQRKYRVEKKAVADGVSPRQNLDEALAEVKRASANADKLYAAVSAAKARVDTAHDHVGNTKLTAPLDGIVQQRFHDPGNTVQVGQPIVRILGLRDLRLRFAVPVDRAKSLPPDTKIKATIDTVATKLDAVVRQATPAPDAASGMIFVEATFTADAATLAQLRPGAAAWVDVP